MIVVVADASVAVQWFVPGDGSARAMKLLGDAVEFHAPESLRPDLAEKLRLNGALTPELIGKCLAALDGIIAVWHTAGDLVEASLGLAIAHNCPVHDLIYLTLARSLKAPLVSANPALLDTLPWGTVMALELWRTRDEPG